MLKNQTINLGVIEKVASALEEINEDVIYVGGAVVSLYVTDEGAELPRPTKDIDISVQISTYAEMEELREKLASKKIYPASYETVIYRYTYEDVLIDFIPYEQTPLGPTNSWLKPGFEKAYPVEIGSTEIDILPVSLFLATKWEAFQNRGNDPRMSHDFEDIIYVIDNNIGLIEDVKSAEDDVKLFLKNMCKTILSHSSRDEIIECHINPFTSEIRKELIIGKLKKILELE
ncbi:nucleotidyl transferase AbiEii/AbiGii toxin family protein [Kordia sp.]|uniref:nucleotidyl transferase AbiEii/AbiGii toxin family protein n=1 Tax=Kordia sp. TaxID=1965332 RepID=UPI003D2AD620